MIISIEVRMKFYHLHSRDNCGCFFSSGLWMEKHHMNGKTTWNCEVDPEQVKVAFPDEYEETCKLFPEFKGIQFPTCGRKYYPFKHGAGALFEVMVGNEWWPIVSELWPEELTNAFEKAQAEWYNVHKGTTASEFKFAVQQSATKPNTCIAPGVPLQCVGKFPLEQFYADGNKALTQQDWVSYFLETPNGHDNHVLDQFSKVCSKWLRNNNLPAPVMLGDSQKVRSAPLANLAADDTDIHGSEESDSVEIEEC